MQSGQFKSAVAEMLDMGGTWSAVEFWVHLYIPDAPTALGMLTLRL